MEVKEKQAKAREYFRFVRDIPYKIPGYDCGAKNTILKTLLESLGFEVRFMVCEFRWSALRLPKDLLAIPHEDLCTHTFLEVKSGQKWLKVDATWDSGLEAIFEIPEWNGKLSTAIAVPATKHYAPDAAQKRVELEVSKEFLKRDWELNGKFYLAFSDWLAKQRK
jgi:arylamine N-acetyltransferase